MYNPFAPIAHMNVRLIEVGDDFWFGGGADLTPMQEFEKTLKTFIKVLVLPVRKKVKTLISSIRKIVMSTFIFHTENL